MCLYSIIMTRETAEAPQPYWYPLTPSEGHIDLHLHTKHSDGQFTPEQLVVTAAKKGLRAIAVTDHDTVSAVREGEHWAAKFGLGFLSGVEISACTAEDGEIHILGYRIDPESPDLLAALARQKKVRLERIRRMLERLCELDIRITYEDVRELAGNASAIGRPHLAKAMLRNGAVSSIDEAFDRFLAKGKPGFVPKMGLSFGEAIEAILAAGGIPIYAHPGLDRKDEILPKLLDMGLRGLEVFHSDHSPEDVEHYSRLMMRHGLLASGGSDCHGGGPKWELLIGTVPVPYRLFEYLKNA